MVLFLVAALLSAPAPTAPDAVGMCATFAQGDIAPGGERVCVDLAYRADHHKLDVWFILSMAHKETRFDPSRRGDGGYSLGVFNVSMLWNCGAVGSRRDRFRSAKDRAKTCDLTEEGFKRMLAIKGEPKARRTKVLSRYKSGRLRVPKSQRLLYHIAAEYKGGPLPNEAAHKSAWRVLDKMRKMKRLYNRNLKRKG